MKKNEKQYFLIESISPISGNEKLICTNCYSEFTEKYFRLSVGEAQYCPSCGIKVEDSIDGWHQVEKESKTMKTFEIYFSDLNIAAQKRLMDAVGISSPSEENWDIDMCPIAIYEFKDSNKDSRDTKRNNKRIIIDVSDAIPNIDVSDKLNRRKRVDVTKLVL